MRNSPPQPISHLNKLVKALKTLNKSKFKKTKRRPPGALVRGPPKSERAAVNIMKNSGSSKSTIKLRLAFKSSTSNMLRVINYRSRQKSEKVVKKYW